MNIKQAYITEYRKQKHNNIINRMHPLSVVFIQALAPIGYPLAWFVEEVLSRSQRAPEALWEWIKDRSYALGVRFPCAVAYNLSRFWESAESKRRKEREKELRKRAVEIEFAKEKEELIERGILKREGIK